MNTTRPCNVAYVCALSSDVISNSQWNKPTALLAINKPVCTSKLATSNTTAPNIHYIKTSTKPVEMLTGNGGGWEQFS
jgi:hypothetical protein